ncbi:MAG: hypothetical protein ACI9CD_000158 [Candidatus Deianiraeaceae bacterium]|jgi:hypothetical protein
MNLILGIKECEAKEGGGDWKGSKEEIDTAEVVQNS